MAKGLLLSSSNGWLIPLVCVLAAIFLLILIISIVKASRKKGIKVDEEFIKDLLNTLGGKENILKYTVDNARVKFELQDLTKADLTHLHELSPKGVFVTGNSVKTLFKYEASTIIKMLDKTLK